MILQRGTEAGNLKVYLKLGQIWAVIGKEHQSLDCDADRDFGAWWIAQSKDFQLRYRPRQVYDDIIIHP